MTFCVHSHSPARTSPDCRLISSEKGPNSTTTLARLDVSKGGSHVTTLSPGRRFYPVEGRVTNEVAIRTSVTGTDLYTILQAISADGRSVQIKTLVNPMVGLIWLAGAVFLLGALITIWPDPREARQIARRYAAALAREA